MYIDKYFIVFEKFFFGQITASDVSYSDIMLNNSLFIIIIKVTYTLKIMFPAKQNCNIKKKHVPTHKNCPVNNFEKKLLLCNSNLVLIFFFKSHVSL